MVGWMWWGWGEEWLAERLGLVVGALLTSSVLLVIALGIISLKVAQENQVIKRQRREKVQKLSVERSFLKEGIERELERLEPQEMRALMLDYVLSTQDLINQCTELGQKSMTLWSKVEGVIEDLSSRGDSEKKPGQNEEE